MTPRPRLASAPVNWGTEPDSAANTDPDAMLTAVAEAGYVGCELGPLRFFGRSAGEIMARFTRHGLEPVAYWHAIDLSQPLFDEARDELREIGATLEALGIRSLLLSDFGAPGRLACVGRADQFTETAWTATDWRQVRATLAIAAALVEPHGVEIAVHPHVGGHIETGAEIAALLEAMEGLPVRLCVDTGHILLGGSDPIALMERFPELIGHLHAKDLDPDLLAAMRRGEMTYDAAIAAGLYCDLGTGCVDWAAVRQAVDRAGYAGWVVAEQDQAPSKDDPRYFARNRRNRGFLAGLFEVAS